MEWMLRDDVHAAAVGRDLVLLDLGSDAYACLRDAGPEGGDFARRLDRLTGAARQTLIDSGFVARRATSQPRFPPPTTATRPLPVLRSSASDFSALFDAMCAQIDLRGAGPDPSVAALIACAIGVVPSGRTDPKAAIQIADQFRRVSPWLPGQRACLQRAALLRRLLRRRGLAADWVFGVRTWPFRAHCWLQLDDVCLTDDPDHLRPYTPILAC